MLVIFRVLLVGFAVSAGPAAADPLWLQNDSSEPGPESPDTRDEVDQDEAGDQEEQPAAEPDVADEEPAAETESSETTAPETFDSLLAEFRDLAAKIDDADGMTREDSEATHDLRERISQFNEVRAATELSVAIEIQLVMWGNEMTDERDAALNRLDGVAVTNPGLRVVWAQHVQERQYKFEKAVAILEGGTIDLATYPLAAVIRAESLVQQNGYDEAQAALDAIPQGAHVRPDLLNRMYYLRQQITDSEEEWLPEREIRAAEAAADDLPRVEIETSKGTILVELFENQAPNTVANFITLIEHSFYDGTLIYETVPNSFVAIGDPTVRPDLVTAPERARLDYVLPKEPATAEDEAIDEASDLSDDADDDAEEPAEGEVVDEEVDATQDEPTEGVVAEEADQEATEDPGVAEDEGEEAKPASRLHFAGVLSMEKSGDAVDPSRFLITLRRRVDRDTRNTVFGRVVDGLAVVRELTGDDSIVAARIVRKREHPYVAETIAVEVEEPAEPPILENPPDEIPDESDDDAVDDSGAATDDVGETTAPGDDGGDGA